MCVCVCVCVCVYLSESKGFQYFGNMRHNSGSLDTFPEIVNVMNPTGL